jgi:dephospho-CoA kinase
MKTFGLTGGVGMGKSTAADLLRAAGLPVVDTDTVARELVEPGQAALADIRKHFGDEIVGDDGRLLRDELARRVFQDPEARLELESILHPRIRRIWEERVAGWRADGRPAAVVVIPLLFETNAAPAFDVTVAVACSESVQIQRLQPRGWTREELGRRMAAQFPVRRKMELADYVVWNDAGIDALAEQLACIFSQTVPSVLQAPSPRFWNPRGFP